MRTLAPFILSIFIATHAFAVPVPWKNCGAAGDIVAVQQLDANVWPPQNSGPTGPVFLSAKVDPEWGDVERLRVVLFPLNWVFELNGDIHARVQDGFVTLPDSWLVSGSPPMFTDLSDFRGLPYLGPESSVLHGYLDRFPIPPGPFLNTVTLPYGGDPSTDPFTLQIRATIGEAIPWMKGRFWMTFDGVSGFPVQPKVGAYTAHLSVTEPGGRGVFCIEVTEPIKFPKTEVAVVERVPFRQFKPLPAGKVGTLLNWSYGYPDETIPSGSMNPRVELRSCSSGDSGGDSGFEEARLEPEYHPENGAWSLNLSDLDMTSSCTEVLIRSALTGQVDGPFRVE